MKEQINIYYAPYKFLSSTSTFLNDLLFPEPYTLLQDMTRNRVKKTGDDRTFFTSCPAVIDQTKNTLVFSFPISCSYKYESDKIETTSRVSLSAEYRKSTLNYGPIYFVQIGYILFADSPLTASFIPPYFHQPKYTKYGTIIPGKFDIGQWFRPFNAEIQMWNESGELHFEEDEPLFYVEFYTDKHLNFIPFEMNNKLYDYSMSMARATGLFGKTQSLASRYIKFNRNNLHNRILTEIKKNLIN